MAKKRIPLIVYRLADIPALCLAMAFVSLWEIGKLADRLRGKEEPLRPKASVRRQNKLIADIWG